MKIADKNNKNRKYNWRNSTLKKLERIEIKR